MTIHSNCFYIPYLSEGAERSVEKRGEEDGICQHIAAKVMVIRQGVSVGATVVKRCSSPENMGSLTAVAAVTPHGPPEGRHGTSTHNAGCVRACDIQ